MKNIVILIFVLVNFVGCGNNKDYENITVTINCIEHTKNVGSANVLLLGDSITMYLPTDIISQDYINCGTGGAKTTDIIRDFDSVIAPKIKNNKIDTVYLAIGVNDVKADEYNNVTTWSTYYLRLQTIIYSLKQYTNNIKVRSILPTTGLFYDMNFGTLCYCNIEKTVAKENGVEYIDTRKYFEDEYGYLKNEYSDGTSIHLSDKGYEVYKQHFTN